MKRGHKKEHTVFSIVFLVLVVGFASFSQGGVVGHASIYEGAERYHHPNALKTDDTGRVEREFITYENRYLMDIRNGIYDIGILLNPDTSSHGALSNEIVLTKNKFTGPASMFSISNHMDINIDIDGDGDSDIYDLRTFRICLNRALYSNWGKGISLDEADAKWRQSGLYSCYSVEGIEEILDANGDGVLDSRDYDLAKAKVYENLVGVNRDKLSEFLECPEYRVGEITHISPLGGLSECRKIDGLPYDFYAWELI